ncbi:hypothetical protein [Sporolactobacillus terrae]|uniref:hypothetical protein n=1 Tax=Sporolactobacillus terrae TaxID=269673 RepID=UPI00111B948C|nr:hypothetical protein [Sporolactobacillus terrae]
MLIQYITDDPQYDNTEVHNLPVDQDRYTKAFEESLITIIKEKFKPYTVESEDDLIAFQSIKDNSIYTIKYDLPGYVTVQSVDNWIYKTVSIYYENKIWSPFSLSCYVFAALENREIKYPVEDTWFDWDLSWGNVKTRKV